MTAGRDKVDALDGASIQCHRVPKEDVVLDDTIGCSGLPDHDSAAVLVESDRIVTDQPAMRVREFRTGVLFRLVRITCDLNSICPVRVNHIVNNDEVTAGAIDAVFFVALLIVSFESIVSDNSSLNPDMVPIAEDSLVQIVVNVITAKNNVVCVVELNSVPAIPHFKALNGDPANRLLPTVLGLQLDAAFAFTLE